MNWHEYFTYNPETGDLIWKERPLEHFANPGACRRWNADYPGKVAGFRAKQQTVGRFYIRVKVNSVHHQAHKVVWEMHYGPKPKELDLDHADRDGCNNRLKNLRLATRAQNNQNSRFRVNNTSGCTGVSWSTKLSKWIAFISKGGRIIRVGAFDEYQDAVDARIGAAEKHYGAFSIHRDTQEA